MPTASFHTLGCKLNFAETSMVGKQLINAGFEVVEFGQPADVCVINTCSVTERADRECRQLIRRAVRTSHEPFVVVTGCYAQLRPDEVASIEGVDLVLGSSEKFELQQYLGTLEKNLYPHIHVGEVAQANNFGQAFSSDVGSRTRAFLKVQDGCDYNCSFCTIPLARGQSRSQSIEACLDQARYLADAGYREVVLTGVNVGDYGKNVGQSLLHLLERMATIEGLERIRISSIEPNLVTPELIDFVASTERMCNHFHIPLQSGDDIILARMRRRYTTRQYRDLIERINGRIPDCGIGVDTIVGFPGETEAHFARTCEFIASLPVSYLHVFTYSERPDTPASSFEGGVEPKVRFRRNKMLRMIGERKREAFYRRFMGSTRWVLLEGDVENGMRFGFTDNYIRVGITAEGTRENDIVQVRLVGIDGNRCIGESVQKELAA